MKLLIYIGVMVGSVFALFAGFAVGGTLFGDTLSGKIIGILIAGLMVLGLGAIGKETGVF